MVRLVRAEKIILSGLVFARKIKQDDIDSEFIGFDESPNDEHDIYAFIYVRNVR